LLGASRNLLGVPRKRLGGRSFFLGTPRNDVETPRAALNPCHPCLKHQPGSFLSRLRE